jgi:hypothetical protein
MLKITAEYDRDTTAAKFKNISRHLSVSLLRVYCNQRVLVDESGIIRTQVENTVDHKMTAVHGTLCTIPPRNINQ